MDLEQISSWSVWQIALFIYLTFLLRAYINFVLRFGLVISAVRQSGYSRKVQKISIGVLLLTGILFAPFHVAVNFFDGTVFTRKFWYKTAEEYKETLDGIASKILEMCEVVDDIWG